MVQMPVYEAVDAFIHYAQGVSCQAQFIREKISFYGPSWTRWRVTSQNYCLSMSPAVDFI
ncbi:MAG: hypothetical protein XXXJIFNMEKO3_00892 [Candidatus Erwinia impunctatus]|nr:hypothetical protein XXXJIFNMEKO_00892 [Culicoides impunctatus]